MDEIDIEAYFRDFWDSSSAPNTYEQREGSGLENRLTREPDLYDHLLWQLHMSDASPALRETCELLIGNLDPDGFLVASFDEIRSMTDGNGAEPCTEEHAEGDCLPAVVRPARRRLPQPPGVPVAPARGT